MIKKWFAAMLLTAALAACGALAESPLERVEYASAARVGDRLYLLGERLYAYDVGGGLSEAPQGALCAEASPDDLLLAAGGDEPHALDTRTGAFYRLGGGAPVARLASECFGDRDDPLMPHRYALPTLAQSGGPLFVLASKRDQPTEYDLMRFDLASGRGEKTGLDGAVLLAPYKAGKLAAVVWKTDLYRVVTIDAATGKAEDTLYEEKNPRYTLTGIAYDAETDRLVVATESQLYQLADQAMIDLCAYLPETRGRDDHRNYVCFLDGSCVFVNGSALFSCTLNAEAARCLRFANTGLNGDIRAFMRRHPDVRVSFAPDMVWDAKTIADSLLSQSSDADVIVLYAGASLSALKRKGYYADLSGSDALTRDVARMQPQVRDALMDGERLAAYPLEMQVSCWLVDGPALEELGYAWENAAMEEWLDFAQGYAEAFDPEESAHALFPPGFTKAQLLRELLTQYVAERERAGALRFDVPELMNALERALKLPKALFLRDDAQGAALDEYDAGPPPLFVSGTWLSPDAYVGFYEDYAPVYAAPPAFADQPTARGMLSVYLVNPYSPNRETAVAFLEACAASARPLLRFYVEQGFDQPIASPEYAALAAQTADELESLRLRLRRADAEERAALEQAQSKQEIVLAYARRHAWLLSDGDVAAYRRLAPRVTLLPDSLCFADSSCGVSPIGLYGLLDRLLDGSLSVRAFAREAQRKYDMARRE
ncbi:MAG: hypothetical protein PHY12_07120 [Eubacteriales bacterium]|nr:hypothetical protein [Eubacteriales bacterium]